MMLWRYVYHQAQLGLDACDVLFQLLRALGLWDTPGIHAGFALLLHFAVFCYLTWFVAYGDPDAP